ncbi:hypothetical protein N7492_002491 [Penicillium capsulatum]|uniref:Major facilitator superfamily (MFS) profile domain-containing protein n=1 Tax=Penicillium capsulatum TaxID=69766 RepID=A0A9W9IP70_9EURO|nr:hypothetical protein N7492_002491 [Penicillium capsulatum]
MAHLGNNLSQSLSSSPTEGTPLLPTHSSLPYSVFTLAQKRLIVLAAALASAFSPLSANIYYPALNSIATDLNVSASQINLTITTYMICQGIAPALTGSFADQAGRRPAYTFCFVTYIIGNMALALQHWFPALLILRAVQSCGSSGTVALASAVAADIITPDERGAYMGLASLGNILAPSLGPIVGGLVSECWGWQAIFWFLVILASAFFLPFLLFFPETCRAVVGDGSIPASGWNRALYPRKSNGQSQDNSPSGTEPTSNATETYNLPNPWSSLKLIFRRPVGLVLMANGVVFGSYYAVTAGIPAQFAKRYNLNALWIGICFIPAGLGSLLSAIVNGLLVDWNYQRTRARAGQPILRQQKHDILTFPIERARLQIAIPMIISAAACIAIYGVLLARTLPLSAVLVVVFAICYCITAAYNVVNVLIVDLYYTTPATAMAANNLVRCFLGAGAAAAVNPMISKLDVQWTYLIVFFALVATIPLLLLVYAKGLDWRREDAGLHLDTTEIPELSGTELNCGNRYLLFFIDLDAVIPGTATSTVVLHWYQPDLIPDCSKKSNSNLLVPDSNTSSPCIAGYIPPQLPPGSHHRYIYLLYEQSETYEFPDCFSHIPPKTLDGRAGFDMREFMSAAGLGSPIALNYFFGRNNASDSEVTSIPSHTTTSFRSMTCTPPTT